MDYGVLNQSLAALRREPFKRCEMVSQLLFGEHFSIIEQHREWFRVIVTHDQYEGWIDNRSCMVIGQEDYELLNGPSILKVATRPFSAQMDGDKFPIKLCPGSSIYNYDTKSSTFTLTEHSYRASTLPFDASETDLRKELVRLVIQYVNTPYLWGGRSHFGIDCSGLTQIIYKMLGFNIPRDANQQVILGQPIDFVNLAQPGDLAFFDNEEGVITHVGIILSEGKIIHSSGYVRVDKIDHQGIFVGFTKTYSHKLRVIKNLLSDLT